MLSVVQFITCLLEEYQDTVQIEGVWRGRAAWSGVADLDGTIKQVVSYRTARSWDFHHSFYLKQEYIDMLEDGELIFWYVNERGQVSTTWVTSGEIKPIANTRAIERAVQKQIFPQVS